MDIQILCILGALALCVLILWGIAFSRAGEIAKLKRALDTASDIHKGQRAAIAGERAISAAVTEECDRFKAEVERLKGEVAAFQDIRDTLTARNQQLSAETIDRQGEIAELISLNYDVSKQVVDLRSELKHLPKRDARGHFTKR